MYASTPQKNNSNITNYEVYKITVKNYDLLYSLYAYTVERNSYTYNISISIQCINNKSFPLPCAFSPSLSGKLSRQW